VLSVFKTLLIHKYLLRSVFAQYLLSIKLNKYIETLKLTTYSDVKLIIREVPVKQSVFIEIKKTEQHRIRQMSLKSNEIVEA